MPQLEKIGSQINKGLFVGFELVVYGFTRLKKKRNVKAIPPETPQGKLHEAQRFADAMCRAAA